ncbi:tRNA pseudouridine synthase D [Desulfosarcina alkanivorans]|uniref:tRNA pseudouridine synthase D n=1 Tax=Desulfosarcina alkanivorans TaxID=571177 RepID=A0A5K7YTJ5_9BACT|nr:tRNA pseudouridine(13) synthase TruD [Desulfosarcina alkanivorans]BBO71620.1 tRNA pseudouridine synthase D [Desulfosarcina alkanivorans]
MTPNSDLTETADRVEAAITMMSPLPFAADPLPGIGGTIKAAPEHFVVEEVLPYAACGEGEHVYVSFRRTGWNTADAARIMQKRLGLAPSDVGWGGRKDKTAVVVQTLSFRCGVKHPLSEVKDALAGLPFDILAIDRHLNKIKTGHVAANRFTVVVSDPVSDALPRALAIADRLKQTGVPNFYGPQRFGRDLQNIHRGFALFSPGKKRPRDTFMVSVVQSALFNIWLKKRMETGDYRRLLAGDIVKKTDTGGMFIVDDPVIEGPRFAAGEIVYTGPIYGFKMKAALNAAGEREATFLDRFHLTPDDFRRLRAPGSRREAILHMTDLEITEVDDGLCFSFTLPSGAYATTVLREFTRQV